MEYQIQHNTEKSRVEAISNDSDIIGLIDYIYNAELNELIVTHTEVDPAYEGRGIAAALTKYLLEYSSDSHLKVVPLCPYTKAYISRHTEYQDLLK